MGRERPGHTRRLERPQKEHWNYRAGAARGSAESPGRGWVCRDDVCPALLLSPVLFENLQVGPFALTARLRETEDSDRKFAAGFGLKYDIDLGLPSRRLPWRWPPSGVKDA